MKFTMFLILILLVSCSTNSKKARNFMESGEWEKARRTWMLVLKKKPADKEALAGKKEAEFRTANKYVISTRTHRERGDFRGAMESALTIHKLLIKWNSNMDPDMAVYQSKELRALYPAYLKLIESSIEANTPIKASYDTQRYFPLFESKSESKLLMLKKKNLVQGQKRCQEILPLHMNRAFFRQFVTKLCSYYQVKSIPKAPKISQHLFSRSSLLTNVRYMPSVDVSMVRANAINAFKETPWYHPAGKNQISMIIEGQYRYKKRAWQEKRVHSYSVPNPKNRKMKIRRQYPYYVTAFERKFGISFNGKIKIENEQIHIPYRSEDSEQGWSYKGNRKPYIPARRAIERNKSMWFKKHYAEYAKEVKFVLRDKWTNRYCQHDVSVSDEMGQGDYVVRCMRGEDEQFYDFLANWHQNNFGINHKQMFELIGRYY